MNENKKYYYQQYICYCLQNANENQARMIYIFALYHMKNAKMIWPKFNIGDKEWEIIHEIFCILRRNPNMDFLRKALTVVSSLERVMYGYEYNQKRKNAVTPGGAES